MDPSTTYKNKKKNLCVADWNVDRGYLTRGKQDELQSYISAQGIDICCTTPRSRSKIDENIDVNKNTVL